MIDIVLSDKKRLQEFGRGLGYSKTLHYKIFNIKFGSNRSFFESKKTEIITNLENHEKKDYLNQKNSGLDQVLCKLAKKNKIAIAFNLPLILKNQPEILGRIKQNIKLCRKYKIPMVLVSFAKDYLDMRNPTDLISLGISLGMTQKEAKEAVSINIEEILERKNKNIITEGIEII
ncbi:MAG: hypothetical protein HYS32_03710 [Candidatus Woesearchaeota archaeon]|nr:MAG: hypothetical protein HYS32_03710 [Candidatus Woesearchaeota archaeon]